MPTTVALQAFPAFYDDFGNPLAGGKVFTYAAGTTTPKATWQDRDGLVLNSNPVILDSAGRADIWLTLNEPYDIVVKNADESQVIRDVLKFYGGADPGQLTAAGIVPATGGGYTGPVTFGGGATFDGTPAQDLATLDSLGIAAVQNANLWINSDAGLWLRAPTTVADNTYGFDRIVNLCDGGSTALSQLARPVDGLPWAMRITQPDATAKRIGFLQIVEARNCIAYRGKSLAFGLRVRCSVAATIRAALVSWNGAIDAPTRDVVNNWLSTNYTAGNFFAASTTPIGVAAASVSATAWTDLVVSSSSAGGVLAPSTMANLYMVVWTDAPLAQNATLDASAFRCGQGTAPPLWTPPDVGVETLRCQRYYETGEGSLDGYQLAGSAASMRVNFKAVKRRVPTLGYASTSSVNIATSSATSPTVNSLAWFASPTATGAFVWEGIWTADAEFI